MFDRNKLISSQPEPEAPVSTIPAEFYGGANPVIKFKTVEKEVSFNHPVATPAEKKRLDKQTAVGAGQPLHPVHILKNRLLVWVGAGVLFVAMIGGISWYYWRQALNSLPARRSPTVAAVAPTLAPASPTPAPASTTLATAGTTPAAGVTSPSSTPNLAAASLGTLDFPSLNLTDSADTANDGLTDVEKNVYQCNTGAADSDNDGYPDGMEVVNLYDPVKTTPRERLVDSGLITDYNNPAFGYKIYYPNPWAIGNVDGSFRDMLFSAVSGESVEARVFDRDPSQTFNDWFNQWAPDQSYTDLRSFRNIFGESGFRRRDNLVYYFIGRDQIFVLLYRPAPAAAVINYRVTMQMMANSFRAPGNQATLVGHANGEVAPLTESAPPAVLTATSTAPGRSVTSTPPESAAVYATPTLKYGKTASSTRL